MIMYLLILFLLITIPYIYKSKISKKQKILFIGIDIIIIIIFSMLIIDNQYDKKINNIIRNMNDDNYDILIIDNFLTAKECDNLIEYSKNNKLVTSETAGEYGIITSDYRNSKQLWISDNQNITANKISYFCEKILNLPKKNMESLQLVRYDVSGYFKEHYDAEPDKTKKSNIIDRAHTFIVYLNDVEEGGWTEFVNLKLKLKPKKGSAIYFKTLMPNGDLLKNSLHQGLPIIKGEKYIVNKWIHLNEFKN
jgi:prolyl 4-hydroxylase